MFVNKMMNTKLLFFLTEIGDGGIRGKLRDSFPLVAIENRSISVRVEPKCLICLKKIQGRLTMIEGSVMKSMIKTSNILKD